MRLLTILLFSLCSYGTLAQTASIKGQLQDTEGGAVVFSNIAIYSSADSSMVKVETTSESGIFSIQGLAPGNYFLEATYVGLSDLRKENIELTEGQQYDIGVLSFSAEGVALEEVTVKASRALVEVKPDRTVFNVQGTINSAGEDAISLLRKAPSVTVDNNDNISVLGRTGVMIYVDGKRLPLSGQDLSAYLQNLPAEQIDRIDIITNPGARYEAEGNAGIIDIRLKRDKNLGTNGSVSGSYSKSTRADFFRYNLSGNLNYRNKILNAFGTLGYGKGDVFNDMDFYSKQNGIVNDEEDRGTRNWNNINYRAGVDFFLSKNHTLGFLVGGNQANGGNIDNNSHILSRIETESTIDSVLIANNTAETERDQYSFNLNYRFDNLKGRSVNVDLDYGQFNNETNRFQPNRYYKDLDKKEKLTEVIKSYDTPTDIKIYTFKLDYEDELLGGKVGLGTKLSRVTSDNTFLVFDVLNDNNFQNNNLSNDFDYDEDVYAGYVSYARSINKKWNFQVGLRAEQTEATGFLETYSPTQPDSLVELSYLSWFPSAGLTWQMAPMHSFALNYGRRINRPDYNVLNPFNSQLSEISFEKGNPGLNPEIVNNIELGYTYAYRYNFKLGYSRTIDQITRLIAPVDTIGGGDPRANFITWANLSKQTIISFNASLPIQIRPKWSAYFNFNASHQDNQAIYADGAVVDVQAFSYSIYQQHTFTLPWKLKAEVSGYFSGPGIWGGVFEYETSWSLNLGLQRKFFNDNLNVRISASDIFFESGWDGISEFDGLVSTGSGRFDSRRVTLSLSYNFGNQNVKSRKRKSGLEEEADRVGN